MDKLKKTIKRLFKKYKQPIRGFIGWLFGIGVQVGTVGADAMMTWDRKRWAIGLGLAALPGIMGWMKGGENNPTDEELYEKVHAVRKARAEAGVEVTDPNGHPLKP
jgi:hypothetical protein